ncbi:hypothetical protein [Microbulbifer sp. THAF38]|uniref:hypothetical protein n=1 Tax=Microbulbifer sp. THAF38 TaxID=2587856 RepID=UPI0012681435|nr:hypothetical protein [Microbulbifer sp. THAF38]QFT56784.1 hypothetical protein FIU95_19720 [Microbulbifer sp. THAF38]
MSDIYQAPQAELAGREESSDFGSVEKGLAGDYSFSIGDAISEGWKLSLSNLGTIWIGLILYFVGVFALAFILFSLFGLSLLGTFDIGSFLLLTFIGPIVLVALCAPLMAGMAMTGIKIARGEKASGTEVFAYFDKIIPLGLVSILTYILISIGYALFIIPGVYLMVAYILALPLVVDQNMGAWQAMEASRKAITHNWFAFFGFLILLVAIYLVGSFAFLIGLIFALPLMCVAYGIAYRQVFGGTSKA